MLGIYFLSYVLEQNETIPDLMYTVGKLRDTLLQRVISIACFSECVAWVIGLQFCRPKSCEMLPLLITLILPFYPYFCRYRPHFSRRLLIPPGAVRPFPSLPLVTPLRERGRPSCRVLPRIGTQAIVTFCFVYYRLLYIPSVCPAVYLRKEYRA